MPTPMRNVRLSDETWELVGEEAARRGISRSELMREAIEDVVLWSKTEDQPAVTRDVQYIVDGPEPALGVLTAIDRLADQLDQQPGWQITVVIDPSTVIVATPVPVRPSEAPLSPQDGFSARGSAPSTPDGSDGRN